MRPPAGERLVSEEGGSTSSVGSCVRKGWGCWEEDFERVLVAVGVFSRLGGAGDAALEVRERRLRAGMAGKKEGSEGRKEEGRALALQQQRLEDKGTVRKL